MGRFGFINEHRKNTSPQIKETVKKRMDRIDKEHKEKTKGIEFKIIIENPTCYVVYRGTEMMDDLEIVSIHLTKAGAEAIIKEFQNIEENNDVFYKIEEEVLSE